MSEIRAISFSQKQCGKHLSDTKKRFVWDFQINGKHYTLELINSTLSGKRTVNLNMEQIYHEKNLLNIDFDFTHKIEGHSFRISRIQDTINKFELRIDNRTFDQVRLGKSKIMKPNLGQDFTKKSNDPFADFQNFASHETTKQTKNNAFGDFDFDSFSKPSTSASSVQKVQQKPQNIAPNNNLLDMGFGEVPKTQNIPVNDFQTNAFQTKNPNGFDDFLSSFKQNETNLMEDESQFSTNAYANRNHYMELQGWGQTSDKYNGEGVSPPVEQPKNKTIKQNLMQYNKMASLATKKAANTVAMRFNEIKKTINESLI